MKFIESTKLIRQYARILNLLRLYKGIDRTEISKRSQLSMQTIYNAIDELSKCNMVLKEGNAMLINSAYETMVGISIGSSLCKISFIDFNFDIFKIDNFISHKEAIGNKLESILNDKKLLNECMKNKDANYLYFKTPNSFTELKQILNCVFDYIQKCIEKSVLNISCIGISCTGIINFKTQTILDVHNLKYLSNRNLDSLIFPEKKDFFNKFDIGVYLIQNSDASVIAEKIHLYQIDSIYKTRENVISIYLGVGIGSGLYLSRLYSGTSGYSGEVGHLKAPKCESEDQIQKHYGLIKEGIIDEYCNCGCADCYDYKIRSYVFEKTAKEFCEMSSNDIREFLIKHPEKRELLGKYLGNMVNTLTSLLNLGLVIFTGKFYKSMDLLINYIDAIRDESPMIFSRNDCHDYISDYGSLSPSIGAAIYAYHKKYDLELSWEY